MKASRRAPRISDTVSFSVKEVSSGFQESSAAMMMAQAKARKKEPAPTSIPNTFVAANASDVVICKG